MHLLDIVVDICFCNIVVDICRKHHAHYPHHFIGGQSHLLRPWYQEVERRKRLRHKLFWRRKEETRKRRKESSNNNDGDDESRIHSKCGRGDEVLSAAAAAAVVGDKRSQITNADSAIRSGVMIAKTEAPSVCLKNVVCGDAEMGGKKMNKKTLGPLTLEKIRQKHGTSNSMKTSMKRPLKERLQLVKTPLKPRVEVTKTKKRIELIKRSKKEDEGLVLIKKEACGTNLSR